MRCLVDRRRSTDQNLIAIFAAQISLSAQVGGCQVVASARQDPTRDKIKVAMSLI
jgi:hypothetical protein